MGSLKRKEGPGGPATSKSPKSATDVRPPKRSKSDKEEGKASSKPAAAKVISKLKEEEPLFPRGGGSVLSPLEHKKISIQAKNDVLFEQKPEGSTKKEKDGKKKRKSLPKTDGPTKERDEDSVQIESLNYKRLVKGSLVLGQIYNVNAQDVSIALPNSLIGHVNITAVSQGLTERLQASLAQLEQQAEEDEVDTEAKDVDDVDLKPLFEVGQYVRGYVLSTTDEDANITGKAKRHIELSLQPDLTNTGLSEQDLVESCTVMASVASAEDHGFVMELGISDSKVRGFLPRKQLDSSISEERMQPGSVLLCIVTSKRANGQVVQLSTLKDKLSNAKSSPKDATTINTFLPGTIADVLVSEVSSRGIIGKVLGHLDVTADRIHSGAFPDDVDLETKFKTGSRVKARIICNFPTADKPKLGFSLLPHVLSMKPKTVSRDGQEISPLAALPSSSHVEKCTVVKVDPGIGLYVDVSVAGVSGFVHISRVKDGKVDALWENSGPYKTGSVHPGRIIGYNAMDGLFLLSFEKRILEQPFLRIEDIPIGEVVSGTIEKLVIRPEGIGGVLVNLAEGITGLVPEIHLADVHLQHPEKKFREGMKVKARVLSTNPSRHQLRLTLAKALVNSDKPPVNSYDELSIGLQTLGTIINILPHGAIVQFYGQLRGYLPVAEMSEAYIHNPKEHFRVGQVVSVHVLNFNPEENRLIVSCKDPSAFGLEKRKALADLKIGELVSAKVTEKTEDDVFVELVGSSLRAILPVGHLTDNSNHKERSVLKKIHAGQTLSDLVVLQKNEGRRAIILSHKPSLVAAAKDGKLITTIEDVRVGDVVQGFVRNITPTAAFVDFAGRLTALLPKSKMPKESQEQDNFGLRNFQPIQVKLTSVDPENGRLVVAIPSVADEDVKRAVKVGEKVINPVDETIISLDDLSIGRLTKAKVVAVKGTQLNVKIADNVQGRVDVSQIFDDWNKIPDRKRPLKRFKPNDVIDVRVLGVHDARNHRFLPITHRSTHSVLELSIKPSDLESQGLPQSLSLEKVEAGSTWIAFVNAIRDNCLWVNLSPNVRGRIAAREVSNDYEELRDLEKSFPVGSALQVRVLAVDLEHAHLDLSAKKDGPDDGLNWDTIKKGMVLAGRVTKVNDRSVIVSLSANLAAPIHAIDLADDYDEANPLASNKNDILRVAVVDLDKSNKKIRLSTRKSRVLNSSLAVKDREITKDTELKVGDIVRGFVKNVADKGLFVNLGGDVVAMVKIRDASDDFLKEWKEHFQVDQVVKGRVVSVEGGRLGMSLKKSVVEGDFKSLTTIFDLKEGQDVTGIVRKVEDFGAFIEIDGSHNLRGLCHRTEMAEKAVKDPKKLYSEGDRVKARVIKVDTKQRRVSLGLKPSYFQDGDDSDMDVDEDAGAALALEDESEDEDDGESEDDEMPDAGAAVHIVGTDKRSDDSDNSDDSEDVEMDDPPSNGLSGLDAGGFDWSGAALDADDGNHDEPVAEKPVPKTKKRQGPEIQVDKTGELDAHGPQTASDYERLLLGQPDDSRLWIAYMALQMQTSGLELAREVAERAIKTINIREEAEKVNVWIAYLNLEIAYGTDEAVEEVFKRACSYNDEQEIHERLTSIYIQSDKHKKAGDLFETMLKKFGSKSPNIWVNYAHFLHATCNQPERARALMKRASQVLGSSTHVYLPLITKFAALEYRSPNGDHEAGRTLFDSLLATYPKKFDIWNQLIDLEISALAAAKAGGEASDTALAVVRDVFERGTKAKGLKAKQAKTWFRRWAQFEEEHGDARRREAVSAKAQEWTRTAAKRKAAEQVEDEE
ncbi:nucleic acid-binding protein [Thozetella sp. PMI_491]|nr:nucleic acid-binding protein [Thozetella sp. PMI_491]